MAYRSNGLREGVYAFAFALGLSGCSTIGKIALDLAGEEYRKPHSATLDDRKETAPVASASRVLPEPKPEAEVTQEPQELKPYVKRVIDAMTGLQEILDKRRADLEKYAGDRFMVDIKYRAAANADCVEKKMKEADNETNRGDADIRAGIEKSVGGSASADVATIATSAATASSSSGSAILPSVGGAGTAGTDQGYETLLRSSNTHLQRVGRALQGYVKEADAGDAHVREAADTARQRAIDSEYRRMADTVARVASTASTALTSGAKHAINIINRVGR